MPFNKSEEKIKVIFVISVIMPSIWNVFIKFRWHDEKLTAVLKIVSLHCAMQLQLCKCINFMPWEDLTGPTPVLNLSLKKLHEGKISAHISFLISKLLLKILAGYKLKLLEFRISFLDLKVCIAFPHTNHRVTSLEQLSVAEFSGE